MPARLRQGRLGRGTSCAHQSFERRSRGFQVEVPVDNNILDLKKFVQKEREDNLLRQCSDSLEGAPYSKPSMNHAADRFLVAQRSSTRQTR